MTVVTTQSELDAAIAAGDNDIRIYWPTDAWLTITGSARVSAFGFARVWAERYVPVHRHSDNATITGGIVYTTEELETSDE